MTKPHKVMVALALFLSALMPVKAATAPPKVVFIGDQFTYLWGTTPGAFPSNWVNKGMTGYTVGEDCFVNCEQGTAAATEERFQTDVINLHPAIVHIMVAADDADADDDASVPYIEPSFLNALQTMIKMAKAANIQVILGTEGTLWSDDGGAIMAPLNSLVVALGADNNIPVINYGDALCGCVGSTGGQGVGQNFAAGAAYMTTNANPGAFMPTPAGYALMTQMAAATINTMNLKLTGGYLQTVQQADGRVGANGAIVNGNTVSTQAVMQFTPYGVYSGLAAAQPMLNANFTGSTGTWASSNPLVMYVNQTGRAWALTAGTTNITYTSPTGVKFSEWTMHVGAGTP
jgi:hypothetical protein